MGTKKDQEVNPGLINHSIGFSFSALGSAITSYPPIAAIETNIALIIVKTMPSMPVPALAKINVRIRAIIKAYSLTALSPKFLYN